MHLLPRSTSLCAGFGRDVWMKGCCRLKSEVCFVYYSLGPWPHDRTIKLSHCGLLFCAKVGVEHEASKGHWDAEVTEKTR